MASKCRLRPATYRSVTGWSISLTAPDTRLPTTYLPLSCVTGTGISRSARWPTRTLGSDQFQALVVQRLRLRPPPALSKQRTPALETLWTLTLPG